MNNEKEKIYLGLVFGGWHTANGEIVLTARIPRNGESPQMTGELIPPLEGETTTEVKVRGVGTFVFFGESTSGECRLL